MNLSLKSATRWSNQKRYYAEHPEKLEERRAKARAYEKRKRERIKAEKALQAQLAMQAQTQATVVNGTGMWAKMKKDV